MTEKVPKKKTKLKQTPKINPENNINKFLMIDLCAGTGAFSLAFQDTNHVDVIYANDFEDSSKLIYDANFNHKLTLGDLCEIDTKTIPKHDVLTAGFPCFVKGTKVLTKNSYKNIEQVNLDDILLTHTGNFQKILNLQQKEYTGIIYELKTMYNSTNILCTEDHPFFVKQHQSNTPIWKTAKQLSLNDYFGMPINTQNKIPIINIKRQINNQITTTTVKLDNIDYLYTIGYFAGCGFIKKLNDSAYIVKFKIALCKKVKNVLNVNRFIWINIFRLFGKNAHNRKIPEFLQEAPINLIIAFIKGYLKATNCTINNDNYKITTESYDFALGLQRLFLKIGYIFEVKNIVGIKFTYQIIGNFNKQKNLNAFIENNYVWYKASYINITNVKKQIVYNFEVDKDNSYIIENVICQNCQPFSIAGKQLGFDDARTNIFWKLIEIIKLRKPKCVILENVKNLVSHDNGDTFKTIILSLEKQGYHIKYKILNTEKITNIPHHRERIYIVCFKEKTHYDKFNFNFPEIKNKKISDLLENNNIHDKYYYNDDSNKIHKMVNESVTEKNIIYQFRRIYVRENKSGVCPTLTANMGSGGHNVPIVLDNIGARKLTPRECFNFQGFPENYVFPKLSDTKLYKLVGNAVSVPVIKLIANKIIESMK